MDDKNFITPTDYFAAVKEKQHTITDEKLRVVYDNCLSLLNKATITGQMDAIKKLIFQLETVEKEIEIVRMGINTFVYKDDIEEYIDDISDKAVKIIELNQYEREIPDEIVGIIANVKDKFDKLYIVFTDYTGEMEQKVAQEDRDKDPILFGAFVNEDDHNALVDRFYYLGDWEDEYCDLTLDKMVNEMETKKSKDILRVINTPADIIEFKAQLRQLEKANDDAKADSWVIKPAPPVKPNIFSKIKTFIGRK